MAIYEEGGVQKYETDFDKIKSFTSYEGVKFDCVDIKYNSNCCGVNCIKCEGGKVCTDYECGIKCDDGFLNCDGVCLAINTHHVIRDNESGETACKCATNYCSVNGDPNSGCPGKLGSNKHCGTCGNACPESLECDNGICKCEYTHFDHCSFESHTYNKNIDVVERCISMDELKDSTNELHLIREENCKDPGEQGYQCDNELHGTNVCHKCAEHYANFDGDWSNGCETDLSVNVTNCGVIGNNCYEKLNKAAGIACVDSRCVYTVCNDTDYLDCNDDSNTETTPDGCETNVKTDANHCGRCGNLCLSNKCVDGVCCYSDNLNITQDPVQFTCCSGNTLYRYAHKPVVCPEPSHYGCASAKPEGDCWSAK